METTNKRETFSEIINGDTPALVDFFAEWCFGCHELDQNVFSKPEVQAKLSQVTALRVDATNMDDPVILKLIDQYSLIGLPTVIFLDRKGREVKQSRVEGAASLEEFSDSMQQWVKEAEIIFK